MEGNKNDHPRYEKLICFLMKFWHEINRAVGNPSVGTLVPDGSLQNSRWKSFRALKEWTAEECLVWDTPTKNRRRRILCLWPFLVQKKRKVSPKHRGRSRKGNYHMKPLLRACQQNASRLTATRRRFEPQLPLWCLAERLSGTSQTCGLQEFISGDPGCDVRV